MSKNGITVHMVVKNEDQWVWYALQSILPYAEQILVTDTGSSDHTLDLIRSIKSPKIVLTTVSATTPAQVTAAREAQLQETSTKWIWVVDGDEVYTKAGAEEIVASTKRDHALIVVRRYDLLGDIYHRQSQSVGSYHLFGERGHLVTRLLNTSKLQGLHYEGDYPNEGFFDGQGRSTQELAKRDVYITHHHLYHAMYLKRSSLGSSLPMFNRSKYKVEQGEGIVGSPPEVFSLPHPLGYNPHNPRSLVYETMAALITPIKNLKRSLCG